MIKSKIADTVGAPLTAKEQIVQIKRALEMARSQFLTANLANEAGYFSHGRIAYLMRIAASIDIGEHGKIEYGIRGHFAGSMIYPEKLDMDFWRI